MMSRTVVYIRTVVCLLLWTACTREAQYIETVTPSENPYLVQVDSFQGNFTVYREDSFVTSTSAFALAGFHHDPDFGTVRSEHFVQMGLPTIPELANSARFDSIELVLKLNDASYGDTMSRFALQAYRLEEQLYNEKKIFYNTSRFTATQSLGSFNAVVRPQADDSIRFLLSASFGSELFGLLRTKSVITGNEEQFLQYFKGLRLAVDTSQTNVMFGFGKDLVMRLHYHEDDGNIHRKSIDFIPSASPYQFNYIFRRYGNSELSPLQSSKDANAALMNNRFFLQEFFRIRTVIDFPDISQLPKTADFVKVLNAQLEIRPVSTTGSYYGLPPALNVYQLQADQTMVGPILNSEGSAQDGDLSLDAVYGKDTRYLFDVTNYVLQEIGADNYSSQKLVLAIGGGDSTLSRFTGNTTAAPSLRSRLIVSMLVYKTQ
ncbi:DUF4270 family protein [Flavihumibacter solisilvae]|nr:DUF4270 family protein [Flavihumibacter solisilvae]